VDPLNQFNISEYIGSPAIVAMIQEIDQQIENLRYKNDTATEEEVYRNQGGIRSLKLLKHILQPKEIKHKDKVWDVNL